MRHPSMVARKHLAFTLFLAVAVTAHAAGADAMGKAEIATIFDTLDENHDGRIVPTEFALNKIKVMSARDRNHDDTLSRDEVLISDEAFAAVDKNNDGVVSGFEFVDGGLGRFENLDHNHDRAIDIGELEAWIMAPD